MLKGSRKYRALVSVGILAGVICLVLSLELAVRAEEYHAWGIVIGILVLLLSVFGIGQTHSWELYQENQRILTVVNLGGELIFEYDTRTGKINWLGDSGQIFQAKKRKLTLERLIHPEDWPFMRQQMEDLKRDKVYSMHIRILDAEGKYLFCSCRMAATKSDKGKVAQTLGVIQPIVAEKS
ncbi:MAG: PAS domain-containing protein [Lachnoclostridium sp.]|nr:PAS domain-containing protein [Lachnospira sp.]MCM1247757.1 PAS domain-containing protein [Lachnoclostridium sp.]MCM1534304.1 PAS domain-containing protein [Clostridium sp.]